MRKEFKDGMLRVSFKPIRQSIKINSPNACVGFLREVWDKELFNIQEQVYAVFANHDNQIMCWRCLNTGSADAFILDIRLLLSIALSCLASKIIIAHNHPGGSYIPSEKDKIVTSKLLQAARFMDIKLIDHIILTKNSHYSFSEHNELE